MARRNTPEWTIRKLRDALPVGNGYTQCLPNLGKSHNLLFPNKWPNRKSRHHQNFGGH